MIAAVRLGTKVFRLGIDQLMLSPAALHARTPRPGSEWLELQIRSVLAAPEHWVMQRDERGFDLLSLAQAQQRREHLERVARNLTPEQHAELWQDTSPEAAELRRVLRSGS